MDFTLSNARRFYSSKGDPWEWKGPTIMGVFSTSYYWYSNLLHEKDDRNLFTNDSELVC